MAKKDPSLSLEYILQKQQSEKLSGLSSTVKQQIGKVPPAGSGMPAENKILSELKKINTSLNNGLNKSLAKIAKSIDSNTSLLAGFVKGTRKQVPPPTKNDLNQQDIEDSEFKSKELHLLEEIRDSLKAKEKVKEDSKLATWLKVLGAALGTLLGLIKGYINFLRKFLPENLLKSLKIRFSNLGKYLEELALNIKGKIGKGLSKIGEVFSESKFGKLLISGFNKLKKFFNFEKINEAFTRFRQIVKNMAAPFVKAYEVIKDMLSGPIEKMTMFFTDIGKSFKLFTGIISKLSTAVKYIFEPILWIIAAYETVEGAIAGFKKEGLVGAIKGGLEGLWNATIGGFLDLVKDISSWVLEKLGFDKASKFLDSFSFKDLYAKFLDLFFAPMKWLQDTLTKITIGPLSVFGKKFGPWKPFAALAAPETTVENPPVANQPSTTKPEPIMAPAIEVKPEQVVSPAPAAAEAIYERSAENEEAAMYPFSQPATNIVNAPTTITRQTQNNIMKVNVRNQEPTIKDYFRSRFAT